MIWIEEIRKLDPYHFFALFAIYSMVGWLIESIYMSFCNHKITNRGFAKGPFCPIYGFGCLGGYLIFAPFRGRYLLIYVCGCIVATTFEYIVGRLMIHFLGELWWDYNEKPFNFQGIICLESTLAWGIYALVVVHLLHGFMIRLVDRIDKRMGILILIVLYFLVFIDYMAQLSQIFGWPKVLGGPGMNATPNVGRAAVVNGHAEASVAREEVKREATEASLDAKTVQEQKKNEL